MSDGRNDKRSKQAWGLSGRRHGIVAWRQLLTLGFSRRAIEHRIRTGRLHPVARGIYAVGWPHLTRERRWMAAVLACGDGAMLSHRSAAALWESLRTPASRPEGSWPADASEPDFSSRNGIPVTAVPRTLVDLATELRPIRLERAVNEADKRDLVDPETLRARLRDYAGEPGARNLRRLLDRDTFRLSDSDLEIYFRPIAARAGLPPPLSKQIVNGWEVDFHWPDLNLVIETDGLRYHRTPSAQARDAKRDRAHVIAGTTPLRFTHYEIRYEPALVRDVLSRAAAMLQAQLSDRSASASDIGHT